MTQPYEIYERTSVPVSAQVSRQLGQEACQSVVVGSAFEDFQDDEAVTESELTDRNLNRLLQLKALYRYSQYGGPSEVHPDIHRNLGIPARRLAREGVDLDEYPRTTSNVD